MERLSLCRTHVLFQDLVAFVKHQAAMLDEQSQLFWEQSKTINEQVAINGKQSATIDKQATLINVSDKIATILCIEIIFTIKTIKLATVQCFKEADISFFTLFLKDDDEENRTTGSSDRRTNHQGES